DPPSLRRCRKCCHIHLRLSGFPRRERHPTTVGRELTCRRVGWGLKIGKRLSIASKRQHPQLECRRIVTNPIEQEATVRRPARRNLVLIVREKNALAAD